jgi:hypothetical protein
MHLCWRQQGFKAGDILTVSWQDESGWWYAELGDQQGFVPSNYVMVMSKGEAIM